MTALLLGAVVAVVFAVLLGMILLVMAVVPAPPNASERLYTIYRQWQSPGELIFQRVVALLCLGASVCATALLAFWVADQVLS